MELVAHITNKRLYPIWKIKLIRIIRYLQTGYLLHLIAIASVIFFFVFCEKLMMVFAEGGPTHAMFLYSYLTLYFFTLPFFSQLDAFSRYQNYKMVKDKMYQYGFDQRLLRPFLYSRCQRDAISVAAVEMSFTKEWKKLIQDFGFRWYHILPHLVVKNPLILLTRKYWIKTLFVKQYHSKYFLW